jgi:hypothetical protein
MRAYVVVLRIAIGILESEVEFDPERHDAFGLRDRLAKFRKSFDCC